MPRQRVDPVSRFWAQVDQSGGPDTCWPWMGRRNAEGYGRWHWNGKSEGTHRIAEEITRGPISAKLYSCHTCDNPPCCNPAHLFRGTAKDNSLDMARKGRGGRPRKLTAQQVYEIRTIHALSTRRSGLIQRIAREYGVSYTTIGNIIYRITWKHVV